MKLRSALVVGSFAAASGTCPKIAPGGRLNRLSPWHLSRLFDCAPVPEGPGRCRALRASRRSPPRRAARENRPHSTAGFSAVAGSDAVAPKKNVKDGFFEWQTKLMDDLASKYAKTDDAAAPASTAAKASSSSSSSSDDSSSDEVVEKKPLGTRLKNVAGRLAFWRK